MIQAIKRKGVNNHPFLYVKLDVLRLNIPLTNGASCDILLVQ